MAWHPSVVSANVFSKVYAFSLNRNKGGMLTQQYYAKSCETLNIDYSSTIFRIRYIELDLFLWVDESLTCAHLILFWLQNFSHRHDIHAIHCSFDRCGSTFYVLIIHLVYHN